MHILRCVFALFPQEKEGVLFVFGTAEARAQGRCWIKVNYDTETQMSCLEVGDEVLSVKVFLPTHKLSQLLAAAFEAQTNDSNAVGHQSWLEERVGGNKRLLSAS